MEMTPGGPPGMATSSARARSRSSAGEPVSDAVGDTVAADVVVDAASVPLVHPASTSAPAATTTSRPRLLRVALIAFSDLPVSVDDRAQYACWMDATTLPTSSLAWKIPLMS